MAEVLVAIVGVADAVVGVCARTRVGARSRERRRLARMVIFTMRVWVGWLFGGG
jgi:hypothetical protein